MNSINTKQQSQRFKRLFRLVSILLMSTLLTGCLHWIRAYQTYRQMDEFDRNFGIEVTDNFTIHFNDPIMYSQDFVSLSKLHPSYSIDSGVGKSWRYNFDKVDKELHQIKPSVNFFFDLKFNAEDRLTDWSFSPLFLQIAPAEFLEVSLRSVAGAKINKGKRQLRANTDLVGKISTELPEKSTVIAKLGKPERIKDKGDREVYYYRFLLNARKIEKGYEKRAVTIVKLAFDKVNHRLIKMAGRFAGLKISIDYRKYLADPAAKSAEKASQTPDAG